MPGCSSSKLSKYLALRRIESFDATLPFQAKRITLLRQGYSMDGRGHCKQTPVIAFMCTVEQLAFTLSFTQLVQYVCSSSSLQLGANATSLGTKRWIDKRLQKEPTVCMTTLWIWCREIRRQILLLTRMYWGRSYSTTRVTFLCCLHGFWSCHPLLHRRLWPDYGCRAE